MQKLGLIGGVGPASTIDYYNYVISGFRAADDSGNYPEFVIENINMTEMLGYVESKDYAKLVIMLLDTIISLKNAGCDFAAICSNTPHVIFDDLSTRTPIPLISIVDATCDFASYAGYRRVLLLGTKFTMQSGFYAEKLTAAGIETIVPTASDIEKIHRIIFPKLEDGIVDNDDKRELLGIIADYRANYNVDAVILGCTELPLMIKADDITLPVLDTTKIHADALVKEILK